LKFISIHHGNLIAADRVVAVLNPSSSPVKRLIQTARDEKRLIDASGGKKTKSVIITDSDHVVLSSLQSQTLSKRLSDVESFAAEEEDDE
jgi:regulator of extracellular matrix RemA (YlzA/DUF370 family)